VCYFATTKKSSCGHYCARCCKPSPGIPQTKQNKNQKEKERQVGRKGNKTLQKSTAVIEIFELRCSFGSTGTRKHKGDGFERHLNQGNFFPDKKKNN